MSDLGVQAIELWKAQEEDRVGETLQSKMSQLVASSPLNMKH